MHLHLRPNRPEQRLLQEDQDLQTMDDLHKQPAVLVQTVTAMIGRMKAHGFPLVISGMNTLDDVMTIALPALLLPVLSVEEKGIGLGIGPLSDMIVGNEDAPDHLMPGLPGDTGHPVQEAVVMTVIRIFLSLGGNQEMFQISRSLFWMMSTG
jgi:hypothetical protein